MGSCKPCWPCLILAWSHSDTVTWWPHVASMPLCCPGYEGFQCQGQVRQVCRVHIRAIFDDALYLVIDSLATSEVVGLASDLKYFGHMRNIWVNEQQVKASQNANSEANPTSSNGGSNRNYWARILGKDVNLQSTIINHIKLTITIDDRRLQLSQKLLSTSHGLSRGWSTLLLKDPNLGNIRRHRGNVEICVSTCTFWGVRNLMMSCL